jgi:xanthine dehydrogenase accessory factor
MSNRKASYLDILKTLTAELERNQLAALVTIVQVQGASPATVGMKILIHPDGGRIGNVGGGLLEERIIKDALNAICEGQSRLAHYSLREEGSDAVGTLCGGEVQVFIEVFMPRPTLLIIGGGHVGQPLAEIARLLDYEVRLVDVRSERGQPFDPASITASTFVVIMTEDAVSDETILRAALPTPAPYIGMIGSRRKCQIVLDHLRADKMDEALLKRVHAPIGLNLGGRQPAEVALAILAEIEMVRHRGHAEPKGTLKMETPCGSGWHG